MVVGPGWGSWKLELDPQGSSLPVYVLPQRFNGKNHFHWYRGLSAIVKEFRPDLLHVDEEHYSLVTAQAMRIARVLKIPAVFQTWQNIYKKYPWPFSAIENFVFHTSVQALAGTPSVSHVLREKGYTKPITIIPLGTDTTLFHPDRNPKYRTHWGLPPGFVIGFVGRLVEEKGIMDLLDAVIPILKQYRDVHCVIAGSGPCHAQVLARFSTANFTNRVTMIPWLSSDHMPHLMNSLDVLVVPSRTTPRWKEQFGRVLTEAMACGTAVIGSNSGEIPNVMESAGVVVPEANPNALRQALLDLYRDGNLRQRMGEAGISRVGQHFSQEIIAAKLAKFYAQW